MFSIFDMLTVINNEGQHVPLAVKVTLPQIAQWRDNVVIASAQGGLLIYSAAGASSHLEILDVCHWYCKTAILRVLSGLPADEVSA